MTGSLSLAASATGNNAATVTASSVTTASIPSPSPGRLNWSEVDETTSVADIGIATTATDPADNTLAAALENTNVKQSKDEEAPDNTLVSGIHPNDSSAQVIITNNEQPNTIYHSAKTFEELGLSKALLDACYELKFTSPSSIQSQAIPIVLSDKKPNLIGQAHHGSGKTATFSLCLLSRVDETQHFAQAIVVVPTRELAVQVTSVIEKLAKFTKISVLCAVPKADKADINAPKVPITQQVVVGTPGTLESKIKFKEIDTRNVVMLVADEADQMCASEGFRDTTVRISRKFNKQSTQILLFSATFDAAVRKFAQTIATNAVDLVVKTEELSLDTISQFSIQCANAQDKYTQLSQIFALCEIGQTIIFVHTVATAKELANKMRSDGYTVSLLHGKDMAVQERDRVMEDFRNGVTLVLITTNVLSRGVDVLQTTLVINYDIPLNKYNRPDPETYIHRIGRSGRFGRKGVAINFVHDQQSVADLEFIEKHFAKQITKLPAGDLETITNLVQKALN